MPGHGGGVDGASRFSAPANTHQNGTADVVGRTPSGTGFYQFPSDGQAYEPSGVKGRHASYTSASGKAGIGAHIERMRCAAAPSGPGRGLSRLPCLPPMAAAADLPGAPCW